ncbi:armadillo-type protein [Lenzites betulinus]|nr:armadillo-type protein [Lenzites betulinus]
MLGLNSPNLSDKGDSSAKRSLSAQVLFLLQHITTTTYVSVSDRLVNTVNGSAPADRCWALRIVMRHIRRTATVHPHLTSLLARLCLRIAEQLSPEVCDENTQDTQGKGLSGSRLLRKYLLDNCQLAFEIRLAAHGLVETAEFDGEDGKDSEAADAWCAMVQEAKNQGPGLARFFGELFKIGLLPMRVVHECVRALLATPREEPLGFRPVEDACVLLSSAGGMMDIPKARVVVDAYLARIESMTGDSQCPLRVRAMWKEIVDLRAQGWITAPDSHNAEAVYKKGIFSMAGFGTSKEQDGFGHPYELEKG